VVGSFQGAAFAAGVEFAIGYWPVLNFCQTLVMARV